MGKWRGELTKGKGKEVVADVDEELAQMLRAAVKPRANSKYHTEPKGIPIELLLALRRKKLPIKAIARICRCSPGNVRTRLGDAINDVCMVEEFKKNRADILAYQQRKVLGSITKQDLDDAGLRDKAVSFGILYDKERLETGKSVGEGIKVLLVNYSGEDNGETTKILSGGGQ